MWYSLFMTYLFYRCGGDCFIVADSITGFAGVITFDACGINPDVSTSRLSQLAHGFQLRGERTYTALQAFAELQSTRHYAEMNDMSITDHQREAWSVDLRQEW